MGFLADLLCFGLTASAVKTITHNITENIKRKNTVCHFDGDISKEEFYAMVRRSGKKNPAYHKLICRWNDGIWYCLFPKWYF